MTVVVVVDVLEVDFGIADRVPGLPGNAQDHERDYQADHRIGDVQTERDDGSTGQHAETDEPVDARVLTVGDKRWALQAATGPKTHLGRELVPQEADHAGGGEQPQVRERARMDEALDRLHERDQRADEDRQHDAEAGELRKKKASPSGIAVSASPKLWIRSASNATLRVRE
jgi:hypothetical protein